MKTKIVTLIAVMLFLGFKSNSQEVMEAEKVMSKGLQSAVIIDLYDVTSRQVESWWRTYVRNYTRKIKKDRKTDEWFGESVSIPDADGAVDLYTRIESAGKYVTVATWVDRDSTFINSSDFPDTYAAAEQFMADFAHMVEVEKIELELKEDEGDLKKLESELKRLQSKNESYHRDIENAKDRIKKAEDNIEKNLIEQENMQQKIDDQMQEVEKVRLKLNDAKNKKKSKRS